MPQRKYTQLSPEERIAIELLLRSAASVRSVARTLGRSPSTISREIRRNRSFAKKSRVNKPAELVLDGRRFRGTARADEIKSKKDSYLRHKERFCKLNYNAKTAGKKAASRHKKQTLLLMQEELSPTKEYIDSKLRERWSPEQISGRLKVKIKERAKAKNRERINKETGKGLLYVSHKAIYKYVHLSGQEKCLRRKGRKRCPAWKFKQDRVNRTKRRIDERPEEINNLIRFGDLEGDTIFGKDTKDRLLTHIDRKTGVVAISLIRSCNTEKVHKQSQLDIKRIFGNAKSITYDNGIEFALWQRTERELNTTIYFANPYHSWERGRNENANGLIRDFFPKGTDFKKLTKQDILKVESMLNNRPRERFQWLTPLEYAKSLGVAVEG